MLHFFIFLNLIKSNSNSLPTKICSSVPVSVVFLGLLLSGAYQVLENGNKTGSQVLEITATIMLCRCPWGLEKDDSSSVALVLCGKLSYQKPLPKKRSQFTGLTGSSCLFCIWTSQTSALQRALYHPLSYLFSLPGRCNSIEVKSSPSLPSKYKPFPSRQSTLIIWIDVDQEF